MVHPICRTVSVSVNLIGMLDSSKREITDEGRFFRIKVIKCENLSKKSKFAADFVHSKTSGFTNVTPSEKSIQHPLAGRAKCQVVQAVPPTFGKLIEKLGNEIQNLDFRGSFVQPNVDYGKPHRS